MELQVKDVSLLTKEQLVEIINAQAKVLCDKPDRQTTMQMIVDLAAKLTFSSGAVVELLEDRDMVYTCVTDNLKGKEGLRLQADSSLSGQCVKENTILLCDDSETDPRVDKEACKKIGLRSMMVVPLYKNTHPVGIIKVFSSKPHAFDEVDKQILSISASIISSTIMSDW